MWQNVINWADEYHDNSKFQSAKVLPILNFINTSTPVAIRIDFMTYDGIITAIKSCEIYDEAEFDAFIDEISVAVADLELSVEQKEELIEQLLLNVEQHPEHEFTSWSLIHFIEWLDEDGSTNYNVEILRSLRRKPKYLTLLLANRIVNALPETSPDRSIYIATLKEVASDPILDEYIRNEANKLYKYQLNNSKNK